MNARVLDRDQFDRDGYAVLRGVYSPAEAAELRDVMVGLLRRLARGDRDPDCGFDPWYPDDGLGDADNPNRVVYLNDLHLRHPRLDEHMRNARLTSVFCDLWNADIKAFQAASVIKPNGYDAEYHGWHQDMVDYVPLSSDRNACAITYLDAMGADTGGTSLVPGSHRGPLLDRTYTEIPGWPSKLRRRSMAGFDPDRSEVVSPDFEPGDVLVFHSNLFHRANSNRTDVSKIDLINVYMAADCVDLESRNAFAAADLPVTRDRRPVPAAGA